MANVQGVRGAEISEALGIVQVEGEERNALTAWRERVMRKETRTRRTEIATMITKKLDVSNVMLIRSLWF
jgi:hypothetical protein